MKKLLLAAFLLTAGLITSENVVAEQSTIQREKEGKPPSAVLQAFAETKAFNASAYVIIFGPERWSASNGKYQAIFPIVPFGLYTYSYNSRGVLQSIFFQ